MPTRYVFLYDIDINDSENGEIKPKNVTGFIIERGYADALVSILEYYDEQNLLAVNKLIGVRETNRFELVEIDKEACIKLIDDNFVNKNYEWR